MSGIRMNWTDEDETLILDMKKKGCTYKSIAEKFGTSPRTIIKKYKSLKVKYSISDGTSFGFLGKHINGVLA